MTESRWRSRLLGNHGNRMHKQINHDSANLVYIKAITCWYLHIRTVKILSRPLVLSLNIQYLLLSLRDFRMEIRTPSSPGATSPSPCRASGGGLLEGPGNRTRNHSFTVPVSLLSFRTVCEKMEVAYQDGTITYAVCQLEQCDKHPCPHGCGHRPHTQAYIEYDQAQRYTRTKALFHSGIHIESARKGRAANYRYCTKDKPGDSIRLEGPLILSTTAAHVHAGQAANTGSKLLEGVKLGKKPKELLECIQTDSELPLLSHAVKFIPLCTAPRKWQTLCIVLYGPGGTGKSSLAKAIATKSGYDIYTKDCSSVYWQGYQGEEAVIFHEFKGAMQISDFKEMLDDHPWEVNIKYSSCQFRARLVVICSNYNPNTWYPTCVSQEYTTEPGYPDAPNQTIPASADYRAFWRRLSPPIGYTYQINSWADADKLRTQINLPAFTEQPRNPMGITLEQLSA